MRVLVVSSYPPRRCGIGTYARDQVEDLRAGGCGVSVLSPHDGAGDLRAEFLGGRAFLRAAAVGGSFDRLIVHFQPALYYRPRAPLSKVATSLALLWLVVRRRRTEIWVHEADSPVAGRPDYVLLGLAFRLAPALVFHTDAERAALERDYGFRVRARLAPHRVHASTAAADMAKEEARARLGLHPGGGPLFVCAGFLQPEKGFERAVRAFAGAFPEAGDPAGPRLVVVGSVRDETPGRRTHAEALRRACAATPGATFLERYLGDEEFDLWVRAADRLVLPYRRSWSSGLLARARALGTPCLVAGVGGLAEQAGPDDDVVASDEELTAAMAAAAGAAIEPRSAATKGTSSG